MVNYIEIPLQGTNAFVAQMSFTLDNIKTRFSNIPIIIDTGCSISTISLRSVLDSDEICSQLKISDIDNNVKYQISYGVETGGTQHDKIISREDKIKSPALKFKHNIIDFYINNMRINHKDIHINYNRKNIILIGMDILKEWDIHIININNICTFLACPYDSINSEYIDRLKQVGIDKS